MPLHRRAVHGPVRRKRPARRRRGLAVVGPPDVRRRRSTGTDAELANCFSRPQAEGVTERSGVAPALETKFLLFDVGQEQDSALSLPPRLALGLIRLSLPASSSAALPHLRSVERPPVRGQVAQRRRRTDVPLRDMRPPVPFGAVALRRRGTSFSF